MRCVSPLCEVNQWHLTQLIVMHIINKTSVAASSWAFHIGIANIKNVSEFAWNGPYASDIKFRNIRIVKYLKTQYLHLWNGMANRFLFVYESVRYVFGTALLFFTFNANRIIGLSNRPRYEPMLGRYARFERWTFHSWEFSETHGTNK